MEAVLPFNGADEDFAADYSAEREPIATMVILSLRYLLCFVAHEEAFTYHTGLYTALYSALSYLIVFLLTNGF
jgi:hypothetical protein